MSGMDGEHGAPLKIQIFYIFIQLKYHTVSGLRQEGKKSF